MTGFTNALLTPVTVSGAGGTNDVEADWGAVGNGSTNDRTALNNAFAWLVAVPNRILTFGTGKTYLTGSSGATAKLTITGGNTWKIVGNGSTIKPANSSLAGSGEAPLTINGSTNFVIDNLIIDGNRANRSTGAANGSNWLLIGISNGSFINNCGSKNAPNEDGVYLSASNSSSLVHSTFPSNILFKEFNTEFCFRNNMSLIQGRNIQVLGGTTKLANGINPEAGIDLEPNAGPADDGLGILDQVLIRGVTFDGNEGPNLSIGRFVQNSTVEGCLFVGRGTVSPNTSYDKASGIYIAAQNHLLVQSNWFKNFGSNYVTVDDVIRVQSGFAEGLRDVTVQNNFFHSTQSTIGVIYEHSASGPGPVAFIGNEFYNNTPATTIYVGAPSWTTVTGNLVVGTPTTPSPTIPWDVTGGGGGSTPIGVTFTDLGTNGNSTGSDITSLAITTSADAPAGTSIVVGFTSTANGDDVSGYSITDTVGNTYTPIGSTTTFNIRDMKLWIAEAITALPSGSSITVTWGTATASQGMAAVCLDHVTAGSPLDQNVTATTGSGTTPASGSGTSSQADEVWIGFVAVRGKTADSFTEDATFTSHSLRGGGTGGGASNVYGTVNLGFRVASNIETKTYAPTLGVSSEWGAKLVSLKLTSTVPTPDVRTNANLFRPTGFSGGFQ